MEMKGIEEIITLNETPGNHTQVTLKGFSKNAMEKSGKYQHTTWM